LSEHYGDCCPGSLAIEQIVFARNYTLRLLDQTPKGDWFRLPPGSVSHVGWQVGHIAFSEYRLAASDTPKTTQGFPAPTSCSLEQDFLVLNACRRHEQAFEGRPDEAELDQPVPQPHPFARTKFLALLWCAHHEMLHAGQIGLLRRHFGFPPLW
jgi:hypothetical protein